MTKESFAIRPAVVEDAATILELIQALADYEDMSAEVLATSESVAATLFGEEADAHCVLAEVGGRAIGMAIYFFNYSTFLTRRGLYLEDLFVIESARGKGYGERLLRYLAEVAVEKGCGRFEWSVLDWNEPAIGFYEKMGASLLKEWRICRVTGESLKDLAGGNMKQ